MSVSKAPAPVAVPFAFVAAAASAAPVAAQPDPDEAKVRRLRAKVLEKINYHKDFDKMNKKEKKTHRMLMKSLRYYNENISDGKCGEVTGMLLGGDEGWAPGTSQDMHDQVINSRSYEYWLIFAYIHRTLH